jgi:hypothetical protein
LVNRKQVLLELTTTTFVCLFDVFGTRKAYKLNCKIDSVDSVGKKMEKLPLAGWINKELSKLLECDVGEEYCK